MRIWLLSDIHDATHPTPWIPTRVPDADVAVVAGDVCEGLARSVGWVADVIRPHMPAVLVAGNHEFYGGTWSAEIAAGREEARRRDVRLLECETVEIAGAVFSGCSLWTSYDLYGADGRRPAMAAASAVMRDHRRINWQRKDPWLRFRPEEAASLHLRSLMFLGNALEAAPATPSRPHVVVTHHAPSGRSVPPEFEGDALNPAFVSPLDDFILRTRPTAWLHGHVHRRADYAIGTTRVIANPRGYPRETTGFDPELVVEL